MNLITFAKKATALKHKRESQILCNQNIKKYFIVDNYQSFLDEILAEDSLNRTFYEFIPGNCHVNLFLDIEIYKEKSPEPFLNYTDLIQRIKKTLNDHLTNADLKPQFIVLQSNCEDKRSYHIIVRIKNNSNQQILFKNAKVLKSIISKLFPKLVEEKIIDTSVYREGLFRTYLSTKENQSRPLIKDDVLSDPFEPIETFVCYTNPHNDFDILNLKELKIQNYNEIYSDESNSDDLSEKSYDDLEFNQKLELKGDDRKVVQKFVRNCYKYRNEHMKDIFIDRARNCIVVALDDHFCHNLDREHQSNHQYIVVDTFSSKQKCHDTECSHFKLNEISLSKFPTELNELILKYLKVNKEEQELIQKAIEECKNYIHQNFDEDIQEIQFDRNELVFKGKSNSTGFQLKGKCPECNVEHHISDTGYCLKCSVCNSIFPKNQLIPVDEKFQALNTFWMKYHQLVNNGTVNININNYYNNSEEEFSCDIQLDSSIFRNKELTKLYNQILDGHKVVVISQLISKLEEDFKYTNGQWFYFNGSIWKEDRETLQFRKRIVKMSSNFSKIQQFYETKKGVSNGSIVKNIKSLVNKLHKTGFEDEIIKGAKMYYYDESFIKNLNSKKHLVPFENGVFDLIKREFRKTKKEDWINLILGYNYDPKVDNPEVHQFIKQILPNKRVRDYVLKKMSECLNGDIPNTNFLMFIGDGANGKSQLLNLMKATMGELAEKVEVTLLTRKRNNANESNSEKIKLMNKRFAFLSEPEDGEKINIGLLKELTGSEEIVARGLYQESVSFVMETKLFLACNDLPEIKGEDTALWRRIRVVDFPSRFVDDPKEPGEFKIDRTLPSRMREDPSWRQTFINVLLDYYYQDILEPEEVKVKTNEYRQENSDFYNWLEENVEYKEGCILQLKEVCELFLNKSKIHSKESSKYKKEIEKWIKERFQNLKWEYGNIKINEKVIKGWKDFKLKEES